ncbi:MAG: carboxypeptidase regulatory-like domain-containing protein [Planctomycetes bacterium]|nr:carboxypeptidase regulatory-like domain-containing protein [Planctomycetota bacterium]
MTPTRMLGGLIVLLAILGSSLFLLRSEEPHVAGNDSTHLEREHRKTSSDPAFVAAPVGSIERRDVEPDTPVELHEKATPSFQITARCVDVSGNPVHDVSFRFQRSAWNPEDRRWENREPFSIRSDERGRFTLAVAIEEQVRDTLELDDERYALRSFGIREPKPDSTIDLGTIVLEVPANIRGRLLDFRGNPITRSWVIVARPLDAASSPSQPLPRALTAPVDEPTEAFVFERLAPGRWKLEAKYPHFGIAEGDVDLGPGETRVITLRQMEERDPFTEVILRVECRNAHAYVGAEFVRLFDPGGHAIAPVTHPDDRWREEFLFRHLEPGPYVARIVDPRFEPWERRDVRPGPEQLFASLRGRSSIRLTVLDAMGVPVDHYGLTLTRFTSETASTLAGMGSAALEDHPNGACVLDGLVPGTYRYRLALDDGTTHEVTIEGLEIGEARDMVFRLPPTSTVAGRVLWEHDGSPVHDAYVSLLSPAQQDDGPRSDVLVKEGRNVFDEARLRKEKYRTRSDERGAFRFENVPSGTWIVAASHGPSNVGSPRPLTSGFLNTRSEPLLLTSSVEGLDLVLPPAGRLHVTVTWPRSVVYSTSLALERREDPESTRAIRCTMPLETGTPSLDIGPLNPGTYDLSALLVGESRVRDVAEHRLEGLLVTAGRTTEVHVDLVTFQPGRLEVRLTANGDPLPDTRVQLQIPDSRRGYLATATNEQGRAVFELVSPGTHDLVLMGSNGPWSTTVPPITILSNETTTVTHDVPLVRRRIVVRDRDTRARLEVCSLFLSPEGDPAHMGSRSLQTNADGSLDLVLPAGSYVLGSQRHRAGETPPHPTRFTWPLPEGSELLIHVDQ